MTDSKNVLKTMEYDYLKCGDCLELMKDIPDGSVDMILCDLPYGNTSMKWDNPIPFEPMWKEINRIVKDSAAVVFFSSGLFTVDLITSNRHMFKYKWIWEKNVPTGMSSAKYRPMKYYEEICVFCKNKTTYNPIMKKRIGVGKACYHYEHYCNPNNHINLEKVKKKYDPDYVQPSDVLKFNVVPNRKGKLHPTQKPIELLEYLIKTYTNEGNIVLDFTMGSGTTCVACVNTNRHYIGFEKEPQFYNIACDRIDKVKSNCGNKKFMGV